MSTVASSVWVDVPGAAGWKFWRPASVGVGGDTCFEGVAKMMMECSTPPPAMPITEADIRKLLAPTFLAKNLADTTIESMLLHYMPDDKRATMWRSPWTAFLAKQPAADKAKLAHALETSRLQSMGPEAREFERADQESKSGEQLVPLHKVDDYLLKVLHTGKQLLPCLREQLKLVGYPTEPPADSAAAHAIKPCGGVYKYSTPDGRHLFLPDDTSMFDVRLRTVHIRGETSPNPLMFKVLWQYLKDKNKEQLAARLVTYMMSGKWRGDVWLLNDLCKKHAQLARSGISFMPVAPSQELTTTTRSVLFLRHPDDNKLYLLSQNGRIMFAAGVKIDLSL